MPCIRDYSDTEVSDEAQFVMPPRESPLHNALHETLHVVIGRLTGLDISDVIDQDDAVWTRLVEPQRFTVAALMAPEVYMSLNNIAFTEHSVSNDRDAVAGCFRPEDVEEVRATNREWLESMLQCPHVLAAIRILSAHMDVELCQNHVMNGVSIYEMIDPILICSPHADDLRKKLNG